MPNAKKNSWRRSRPFRRFFTHTFFRGTLFSSLLRQSSKGKSRTQGNLFHPIPYRRLGAWPSGCYRRAGRCVEAQIHGSLVDVSLLPRDILRALHCPDIELFKPPMGTDSRLEDGNEVSRTYRTTISQSRENLCKTIEHESPR